MWPEVRAHWVEHHRCLEQDEHEPFAPAEDELPELRQQFATALAPITAAEVDWDSVTGRWVAGGWRWISWASASSGSGRSSSCSARCSRCSSAASTARRLAQTAKSLQPNR
ncbi:hypothetical protein [Streptomyces melanogenes]|uniref:Uncharacterized protein n=1 Tax=Streptomyces melanogenes TaxID=67326 RepID=A0ABZ1XUZ8_9ACTN|nr:hypothetical protein [Streptomyces melanogenes]